MGGILCHSLILSAFVTTIITNLSAGVLWVRPITPGGLGTTFDMTALRSVRISRQDVRGILRFHNSAALDL